MRILVTGATGYIGGRLVPRLLERGHSVRALARHGARLSGRFGDIEVVDGDVLENRGLDEAMEGIDCAYYLVHSMMATRSYRDADRTAARNFAEAAARARVKRIIYLGGLGDDEHALSEHLRSRHEVGDRLRSTGIPVTEFRAAQIVGSGSVSFEMIRYLTERLPVMIAPRWVRTRCQPISIRNVLAYLIEALEREQTAGKIYEIGGAAVLTYREMMLRYAAIRGLKRSIVIVPFFTPRLSSYWIHLVTPIPARIAQPLILGLNNEVVARTDDARRDFDVVLDDYDTAVQRALNRYATVGPETTWFDAYDLRVLPRDFSGVSEGMLIDRRTRHCHAPPEVLARTFTAIGGTEGWFAAKALWQLRGFLDRVVGGAGLRRGRRSQSDVRLGDAIDFWRVDAYEPGRLLRLRAEMKLPGYAWLQFEAESDGNGSLLRQTAFYEPRGLSGLLYWYTIAIFHEYVFAKMAERIARSAEAQVSGGRGVAPAVERASRR